MKDLPNYQKLQNKRKAKLSNLLTLVDLKGSFSSMTL
jgi:hypothetical protein